MRWFVLVVAACGTPPTIDNGVDFTLLDAPAACAERAPVVPAHLHNGVLTTFAGKSCIKGGCHLEGMTGLGADAFEFAGTVFNNDGFTPNQGATVRISPLVGGGASAITDSAGGFFLRAGTLAQPFPSRAQATVCPALQDMPDGLVQNSGDCNNPGCHAQAGAMPIHL